MLWCCRTPVIPPLGVSRIYFANYYESDFDGSPIAGGAPVWLGVPPFPTATWVAPNFPFPDAITSLSPVVIGAKLSVGDPENPSDPEQEPPTPTTRYLTYYLGNTLRQPGSYPSGSIPQGATITSARYLLKRSVAIPSGPAVDGYVRVLNSSQTLTGAPFASTEWDVDLWTGVPFLPRRAASFSGDVIVDITADIQAIVNLPTWNTSPTHRVFTVIAFTKYSAPRWINNIHPTLVYPAKPSTNTGVWYSVQQGLTDSDQTNAIIDIKWT